MYIIKCQQRLSLQILTRISLRDFCFLIFFHTILAIKLLKIVIVVKKRLQVIQSHLYRICDLVSKI